MRPIKRGVLKEYDEIADTMGTPLANKTILKWAIERAGDGAGLTIKRKMPVYTADPGEVFRTKRKVDDKLVTMIKAEFDPLSVLSEYALGQIVADVVITNYINTTGSED